MTKSLFGAILIAILFFACNVDAHAWMSYPSPRGQYTNPPKRVDFEYAPTAGNTPNAQEFVCRNDPEMPKAKWLPLTAGKSQSITIEYNAVHPGDCFVYLTYDGDKPQNEMKWFKIWQQHECYKQTNYNVAIPSYLPSGEHVIFRWEWYALHAFPTVEYYTQCVDATMTGSATGALPSPQVNIPGHLPTMAGTFQKGDNNYWWPYDNQGMFFTGPAVATLNGATSAPSTPRPTTTPTPTDYPTYTPTYKPTSTPTYKPTSTPSSPPTSTPSSPPTSTPTIKPTSTPSNPPTIKPTSTPTNKPTSSPPTNKPTSSPPNPPSVAPTTRPTDPPAFSVKLLVNPSSSVWWFACSVAGHRAAEISKVEIKDSSEGSTFKSMVNEWADVYTFNPQSSSLVLPLTIKASLPSGSSISFTVNSVSSTTIDSGAVFP